MLQTRVMIDQGNTLRSGIAISRELHKKLNGKFEKIGGRTANTAKKGAKLKIIGQSEPMYIQFKGLGAKKYVVKPTVIEDFGDEVNIGSKFLQQHNCELRFQENGTTIVIGNREVPLIKTIADADVKISQTDMGQARPQTNMRKEKSATGAATAGLFGNVGITEQFRNETPNATGEAKKTSDGLEVRKSRPGARIVESRRRETSRGGVQGYPVVCQDDIVMKKNQLTFVKIPRMKRPGDILVEPLKENGGEARVQAVPACYRDPGKIAMLNLSEENFLIRKGSQIATYQRVRIKKPVTGSEGIKDLREEDKTTKEEIVRNMVSALKIDENEMLKENPTVKRRVLELIEEYYDVFADPETQFGHTNLMEFEINVKEDKPIRERVRPLNPDQKASLKTQLNTWLEGDVIEPSESPWAAALVPAFKKGGTIRWAVDYRKLNDITVGDSYPLPNIAENLDKLQGSKIYSCLDAAAAYHTISVKKECRPYLAFTTPYGLYQFKRMPFGPKNAPACYSRFIDLCLQKLRSPMVMAYLDDIIIHTATLEQHVDELKRVLQMHREAGIKLRASKTFVFQKEVDYLGFRITQEGIKMKEEYVQRIQEWARPTTVKELSGFLGFTGYYRSFLPKYSELTNEMNAQKRATKLDWTPIMESKFQQLKKEFEKSPVRAYPRYDGKEPFELTVDFSCENVAAILSQRQEGEEKFIAAMGRKTTRYERNYASVKGELAALVWGLRKFEHILRFRPFIVNTDSAALKYLKNIKTPRGIWFRWLQEVTSYNMTVRHRPGKKNTNADGLSRAGHLPPATAEEEAEQGEYLCAIDDENLLDNELIKEAQREDEVLSQVREWLREGRTPSRKELRGQGEELHAYAQRIGTIYEEDDILYLRYQCNRTTGQQRRRILVPEALKERVFYWTHKHPSCGHFGRQATVLRASPRFYWPGMTADLKRMVGKCPECLTKIRQCNQRDVPHKPQKSGFPGERLSVDLVGPLPETVNGYRYVMTVEDMFTKFVQAFPIANKEAETCANVLIDRQICLFGCPGEIHTDQGKEFHNKLWAQLMDRLEIRKTTTPTYNPNSNPVERFHRTLNQIMRIFLQREDPGWYKYLPMACLAYNTKVNTTTGVTPFEGHMGRSCRLPIDLILPQPQSRYETVQESVQATIDRFHEMYQFMRRNHEATFQRNARLYTGKEHKFATGDTVWYFCTRRVPGKPTKITDQWIGPYRVVGQPAPVLLRLKPADYEGEEVVVHVTRVRHYTGPKDQRKNQIPARLVLEDEGDELAEEIQVGDRWVTDELRIPVRITDGEGEIRDLPGMGSGGIPLPKETVPKRRGRPPKVHKGKGPNMKRGGGNDDEDDQPDKKKSLVQEREDGEESNSTDQTGKKRGRDSDDTDEEGAKGPKLDLKRGAEELSEIQAKELKLDLKRERRETLFSDEEEPKRVRTSVSSQASQQEPGPSRTSGQGTGRKLIIPSKELFASDSESDEGKIKQLDAWKPVTVKISRQSTTPKQATTGAACYDITSSQSIKLAPRQTTSVDIRLQAEIPAGYFIYLFSRSGLATKGISTVGGIIDSDFRGDIKALLRNDSDEEFQVQRGQRIAQAALLPRIEVRWKKEETLTSTDRGNRGFGSTGC